MNSDMILVGVVRELTETEETGLYLPGKLLTILFPQVSDSSQRINSGVKVRVGPRGLENPLFILPPPILR